MHLKPGKFSGTISEDLMFRKTYLTFLFSASLILAGGIAAAAQTAPVRGHINLKKADGVSPAVDVKVEAYRTDISKGKPMVTTTSKKGDFQFAGFMLGQTYALAISGPGISPQVYPKVKAGMEDIQIEVVEGDGRTLTEEEARKAADSALPAENSEMTEAQKKEQAEFEKKNAEITAKNDKIKAGDEIVKRANTEGRAALDAKNYDLAISKYNEGIEAVPDFVGSTPVLMNGKLVALRARGYNLYIEGAKSQDPSLRLAKYEAAKKEYNDALATYDAAKAILKAAGPGTDPNDQKYRANIAQELLTNVVEVHRLMAVGQVDTTRADQAGPLFEEYITGEVDAAKKLKARQNLGDVYRNVGQFEKAIASYKLVLEAAPDNQEVMALIGLCYFGLGTSVDPPDKAQLQEGLNYLDKYAQSVQILDTDSVSQKEFKQSVKDAVTYLKTEQNLKAQKPAVSAPKRKN